ncbi:recombinase family protein [Mycobacterium colombiense]|uniref:recombinase family protein n=1 Tax=Mycobacterium colombiense TaxID=339268 RepID=UPI00200B360F|nr:recombinase family protein [Mycobacterium colombiense]MCK8646893.1 recombinase family protein [Mycobacterium colombiense]
MTKPNNGPPKAIGYVRVSTKDQGENGYGLEAQTHQLEIYCAANNLSLVAVIPDVMSGRKTDKLYGRIAAVAAIRAGLANVLVINALDRVSRNTLDGLTLVKDAQDEGWRVLSLDGVDSDKVEKLWLTVRMGFAEEERDKISKRTKQGLIKARQAGKEPGRRSTIPRDVIDRIVAMRIQEGKGANTIARILTEDGVPTPGGGQAWYPTAIRGVLVREGVE